MCKANLNIWLLVWVLVVVLAGQAAEGKLITVDDDAPANYSIIQDAINYASDGDEIEVRPGTYNEAINFKGKAVRLYSSDGPDATTIDANGAYHVVQCVSGEDANTILEGFTITDGDANGTSPNNEGGGMYNYGSSPTVTNCIFTGNSADYCGGGMENNNSSPTVTNCIFTGNSAGYGGGMYNWLSSPTVTNCTFSGNTAYSDGGGMFNDNGSNLTVTDCIFTGNSATCGGGMYNYDNSSPTVTNCTFSGNTVYFGGGCIGGGMCNSGSSPMVTNCTFTGNSATCGGGMYNYDNSSPTVTNCILSGNSAGENGGGMYNYDNSSPTVISCTFIDNEVDLYGGGVLNDADSNPSFVNCIFTGNVSGSYGGGMHNNYQSNPTLTNCTLSGNTAYLNGGMCNYESCNPVVTNCILWGNTTNQIFDWTGTGCSTTVTYSDVQGGWLGAGGNNINEDPRFVDAAAGNLRLKLDSLCIDAADNNSVPADTADLDNDGNTVEPIPFDLGGLPRFIDGDKNDTVIVDMGTYEYIETLRLVAHWKLDEYYGDTAYDSAGENHGTLHGGPFWLPTSGQVGGALQLDGVDDYVDCGNNGSLNIKDEITIALWVKTNDTGNGDHNPYVTKGDHSFALKHNYTNYIDFFIYDSDWHTVWSQVESSFNGVWHHLAGTYNGNDLKLYIDGRLKATTSYAGSINISAYNVNIGRNSEKTDRFYNGLIDDVRIYNYALSVDEIAGILCTEPIKSDLDGNCKVDFRDFALLLSDWLSCNLPWQELCWE